MYLYRYGKAMGRWRALRAIVQWICEAYINTFPRRPRRVCVAIYDSSHTFNDVECCVPLAKSISQRARRPRRNVYTWINVFRGIPI